MILEKINKPNDIKKVKPSDYQLLASEIRSFLLDKISENGGHLASNLGVVELTMALHLVLDFPEDKIVWDVGHQSYTHKILTGRKDNFDSLRKYGGMSGFPKRRESKADCFDTGHSSTSISAALGIANGFRLSNNPANVVAVIGDGALTGGMAFEALNNVSGLKRKFMIILNDNNMSISENVGGLSTHLSQLRIDEKYLNFKDMVEKELLSIPGFGNKLVKQLKKTKSGLKQLLVPGMIFENMGIKYLGPVDGHNISDMVKLFKEAKKFNEPVVIHVITKKGKGYGPAEKFPDKFHGVSPFGKATGVAISKSAKATYTQIFSNTICELGKADKKVVAISAAMPDGTGLSKFKKMFPNRFFDVGIAEQHAVTYSAGLAASGLKPFVAIYSSFLQRAYDQIMMDVCIQDQPVVFCLDRAGLVGSDGETHQGIFDISYLSTIPNMNIFAPKNGKELESVLKFAHTFNGPLAIRYPRGEAYEGLSEFNEPIEYGKSEILYLEKDIALLAAGTMVEVADEVRKRLKEIGYNVSLINARFLRPIDEECINKLAETHEYIVTMEENVLNGGFGSKVLQFVNVQDLPVKVINIAIPNVYIEHGNVNLLKKEARIDADSVYNRLINIFMNNKE